MATAELFRMKIISKRQVTLSQRLMDRLKLKIGDELQIEVDERNQVRLVPVTLVRSDLFTPQIRHLLEQREKELGKPGAAVEMSVDELFRSLESKAAVTTSHSVKEAPLKLNTM